MKEKKRFSERRKMNVVTNLSWKQPCSALSSNILTRYARNTSRFLLRLTPCDDKIRCVNKSTCDKDLAYC